MFDLRPRRLPVVLILAIATVTAACSTATPTPSASLAASPGGSGTAAPSPSSGATTSDGASPSPTPEPPLSLALPERRDDRRIRVAVDPQVDANGDGQIVVTVTSLFTDRRVRQLVLRWPTGVGDVLLLAPFRPSQQRIANGGPPLVQDWTKWVEGPGEHGEPAGTISLGWGPLLPGGTLTIPIQVTRRAPGPVAFDLQVLGQEAILTTEDGEPAELRVSVP